MFNNYKVKHCTLWINYEDDSKEVRYIEIEFSKILDLLIHAREVIDYQENQLVILPDAVNIRTESTIHKLKSGRVIIDVIAFWKSYIYKEKAIELYLNTLNHG